MRAYLDRCRHRLLDCIPKKVRVWVVERWPLLGLAAFVVLGTVAFVVIGNILGDVRHNQARISELAAGNRRLATGNRRLNCAISKAITANPIVRIPQFESEREFERRVAALRLILRLSKGIDCNVVLAPVSTTGANLRPYPLPKFPPGGGAQSPSQGGQLPGGR